MQSCASCPTRTLESILVIDDQVGLAAALHNLGFQAYEVMCISLQKKSTPAEVLAHGQHMQSSAADLDSARLAAPEEGLPQIAAVHFTSTEDAGAPPVAEAQPTGDDLRATQEGDWQTLAERNALARRKAYQWVKSAPLHGLLQMRLCMQPLCALLKDYIRSAGERWQVTAATSSGD